MLIAKTLIGIFLIIGILSYCFFLIKKPKKKYRNEKTDSNYTRIESLLSKNELVFYKILNLAINKDQVINAKVRMADIMKPEAKRGYLASFNKIAMKHIDFIVCEKKTMKVICGFELDDKSHDNKDRINRDIFVNKACKSANIKLHRIKSSNSYSIESIKNLIRGEENEIN